MAFSDYTLGVYILGLYAQAIGQPQSNVIDAYKWRYGDDAVASLGRGSQNVNFSVVKSKLQSYADQNERATLPGRADLRQILIDVGAKQDSVVSQVSDAVTSSVGEIAQGAFTGFKWLTVAAGIGLVVYMGVQFGWFKNGLRARG